MWAVSAANIYFGPQRSGLLSVTGEWTMGGGAEEVTRGTSVLWRVFKSRKPTQV